MMKAQLSQRTRYPESIDVLDIPDEVIEDDADAVDAVVTYQGTRIGVKQALAKMAADDAVDAADVSSLDDWDVRMLREWVGSGYSDDSLPEFDPIDD
jgi:hypothetical protein